MTARSKDKGYPKRYARRVQTRIGSIKRSFDNEPYTGVPKASNDSKGYHAHPTRAGVNAFEALEIEFVSSDIMQSPDPR